MGTAGLAVHTAAFKNAAGILHRHTAVGFGEHDDQYYRDENDDNIDNQSYQV
jgi:hypothetical protein